MATVSFLLRTKVIDKNTTVWVRFRDKKVDVKQPIPYLQVKLNEWKDGRCKSASKKMFITDEETINVRLSQLENAIINNFHNEKPLGDFTNWLKEMITPKCEVKEVNDYSENVFEFIDTYIEIKKHHVSLSTIKKINGLKQLIKRYIDFKRGQSRNFKDLFFKDLNNYFRKDFESYCKQQQYKITTTYKNLKFLKMISKVANSFDIEINKHVESWRFEVEKASKNDPKSIYLTFEDINKIINSEQPHDYLENARDWLITACYTGQRCSDYLNFTTDNIVTDADGQKYLEFTQKKTNAKMKIPLLKNVQEILDKRNGEFPRKISDVKLNLYIKEVCEIAGLCEKVYNGKSWTFICESGERRTRKIYAKFPKYELVTSHIGRKSFASNFYEIIPTTYLLNFTGHTTEKQLLTYINKTETEKAKSTAKVFSDLGY
ncbi:MAG: phage integrase SAM-like domain-containing protein [Kaistella sp.]